MSDFDEMNVGPRWYVAHTYSGYENKVKMNLEKIVANRGIGHLIFDVRIPTETIVEVSGDGGEKEVDSKIFPSYVLVKMTMTEESWHVVRNIRGVTGFVGPGSKPVPLSDEEAEAIIGKEKVTLVTLTVGEDVDIIDGLFNGFSGKISDITPDGETVTVIVPTAGRDMPVTLERTQVRRKAK